MLKHIQDRTYANVLVAATTAIPPPPPPCLPPRRDRLELMPMRQEHQGVVAFGELRDDNQDVIATAPASDENHHGGVEQDDGGDDDDDSDDDDEDGGDDDEEAEDGVRRVSIERDTQFLGRFTCLRRRQTLLVFGSLLLTNAFAFAMLMFRAYSAAADVTEADEDYADDDNAPENASKLASQDAAAAVPRRIAQSLIIEADNMPNTLWHRVSKNAGLLCLVDLFILSLTIGHSSLYSSSWPRLGRSLHTGSACFALFFAVLHIVAHAWIMYDATWSSILYYDLHSYLNVFARQHITGFLLFGTLMFLLISMLNYPRIGESRRRLRHTFGAVLFLIIGVVHTYLLGSILLYPLFFVYLPSLLRRVFITVTVQTHMIARDFVTIDLVIPRTCLANALFVRALLRCRGDVKIWMVCRNASLFRSCLITVVEYRMRACSVHLRILVPRGSSEDECDEESESSRWNRLIYDTLVLNRKYNLYSDGLSVSIVGHARGNFNDSAMRRATSILFLLENADIATFLAYVNMICDTTNLKLRDRVRKIHLHYFFEDIAYLDLLREYMHVTFMRKFVQINLQLYSSIGEYCKDKSVIACSRLNPRLALRQFVDACTSDASFSSSVIYATNARLQKRLRRLLLSEKCTNIALV